MLRKNHLEGRYQLSVVSLEQLVPQDHLLRKIDQAIDFSFIYDLVEDKYSKDTGRPSIDPVVLIKIVLIQYLFGIRSMRQTIKEIETNVAYRWRSEEHTSELQSRENLVCRLLLEKKKNTARNH